MDFIKRFGGKVPGEEGWEEWVWNEDGAGKIAPKAKL